MLFRKLSDFFAAWGGKSTGQLRQLVDEINALEPKAKELTDEQLKLESGKLRELLASGPLRHSASEASKTLDDLLPYAFALVREAAKRTLGQRHFDVQLMGGIALHHGKIVEMRTGEGKTLAATAPAYLNALSGNGVHVVTVNEYLAKRDTVWMGQIYQALGLQIACLIHDGARLYDPDYKVAKAEVLIDRERDVTGGYLVQEDYLRPISRREAYQTDITYGTNHEFGFDYLRDNLAYRLEDQVQRHSVIAIRQPAEKQSQDEIATPPKSPRDDQPFYFAIIDEVDSILIDEARTPLIISAPDAESSQYYKTFARVARNLKRDEDYVVDEKLRAVEITQEGIDKVEKTLNIKDLYGAENLRLTHYLVESLKAHALFQKDKDYVVKNNEIIIVDQFTGRLMLGRRYSGGLHQAIEAKEGVAVQNESRTYASISIQNYFRMYKKLSGMTGTAQTSAEEFDKVYSLKVETIPTNQPMVRQDLPDLIYKTKEGKYAAIIKDIKERTTQGQPILIGTVSIEKNEELARRLNQSGIRHELLNAKNHEREGAIIAQAGRTGAATVATNMAGRGVDIILGGNPPSSAESAKVREVGGLHVIGTERHESRRIDNQLRGRAGRQGDPGSSQFFLSLEDDLLRIFGGERIKGLMERLKVPEDMPIQAGMLNRAIAQSQSKVEGFNFDARKHLLEYDDVLNKQRQTIYKKRQQILVGGKYQVSNTEKGKKSNKDNKGNDEEIAEGSDQPLSREIALPHGVVPMVLQMLDLLWLNHLENMEALGESVRLRAYGQHDPLVEYKREGHMLFQQLLKDFDKWIEDNRDKLSNSNDQFSTNSQSSVTDQSKIAKLKIENSSDFAEGKIGRNDPCPCGAKHSDGRPMKYKHCHGKNS